jgi:orotate phosphoribosyltransferase
VAKADLVSHLKDHALRTDGPFTLRSGAQSSWYLDARQTTFDGAGAAAAGQAVLEVLDPVVAAVGGMTMGADPIAVAAAILATEGGRPMRAFSIRKTAKEHGTGGRLVGPVQPGDEVAILEDTTTTGSAAAEAAEVAMAEGLVVIQVIALIDRSGGVAAGRFEGLDLEYEALVVPADLGVV